MQTTPVSPATYHGNGEVNVTDNRETLRWLIDSLALHGDKPCILSLHGSEMERWSYAQVSDHVQQLATGLVAAGVERGEHIVLLAKNRPEWYVASLAVIAAGAVVVPLDTGITSAVLAHTLRDSAARWIFTTTDYLNRIAQLDLPSPPRALLLDVAPEDSRGWRALQAPAPAALPRVAPGDPAVLFYTSGTTGVPKGVPLTHRNLAFQVDSLLKLGIVTSADSALQPLPMYHVYPFTIGGLLIMALGSYIVLPGGMTGPQVMHAIQQGKPTAIVGVPRLYRAVYDGIEAQATRSALLGRIFRLGMGLSLWLQRRTGRHVGRVLLSRVHKRVGPHLRLLASGGSALDPALAEKLEGVGWEVAIGYGLTETSPLLTAKLPGPRKPGSVGKPLPGIEIRIDTSVSSVDGAAAETDGATPPQGEVLAHGPSVFSGYRNLPEQTAAAFTPDGWFRTGDLGYLDADGYLYITGRANTLLVLEGGKKIQPDVLEDVYAQHPVIQEAGILKAHSQLAAVIVPEMSEVMRWTNGDVDLAVRQAVKELSQQLPTHQRVTDYVTSLEPLPKTNLGKIRRQQLVELYEQTKQGLAATTPAAHPLAIEDMSEQDRALLDNPAARQVWEWLAERYPDRALTPDSSPQLELGVDSLSWLTLTLEIGERTGVELSDEAIGQVVTVRDLLSEVSAASQTTDQQVSAAAESAAALTPEEQRWLEPLHPALAAINVLLLLLNKQLMRWLFCLEVRGAEHLPAGGPLVLAPNHRSYLDSVALAGALPLRHLLRVYWAAGADVMFRNPVLRLVSRAMRIIPITRNVGTGRSSLAFGEMVVRRGSTLVWFPEGSMTRTGSLLPFRKGLGLVLEKEPATVVPVFIRGTDEALPPNKARLRLRPLSITFGPACDSRDLAQQGAGEGAAARIVAALHDRVADLGAG